MATQIFNILKREENKKPYLVKWRVDGRDRTRSFSTKREAEVFKRKLQRAIEDGNDFNSLTGFPDTWVKSKMTFAECVNEMTKLKSNSWESKSMDSFADAISGSLYFLIQPRMKSQYSREEITKVARTYVVDYGNSSLIPSPAEQVILDHIYKYSLRLSELSTELIEETLAYQGTLLGGGAVAKRTFIRREQALNQVLVHAFKRKYILENPIDRATFTLGSQITEVQLGGVLTVDECRKITKDVKQRSSKKDPTLPEKMSIYMSIGWLAGLRPSEISGLIKSDIHLGKNKSITVSRASVTVSKSVSKTNESFVVKGLKARNQGQSRVVPINSELEKILRPYVKNLSPGDLLFTNKGQTKPISTDQVSNWFEKVRPHKNFSLYDLRHTYASVLIYAGHNVVDVAKRMGNSPVLCMRTYIHQFEDAQAVSTKKEDIYLNKKPVKKRTSKVSPKKKVSIKKR
jgi:integrase